jgi:WD40 repeat protein
LPVSAAVPLGKRHRPAEAPQSMSTTTAALFLLASSTWFEPSPVDPPITAAAITPDGKHAVLGSQRGIEVRSWPGLQPDATILTELVHMHDLAFSPNGRWLLAAGGAPAEDGAVEIISWPDKQRVRRLIGHKDVIYRVACSPDAALIATAGGDGICHVYDSSTGERLVRYEGHSRPVLAIAWLPDGATIVSAGVDQTLQLWDGRTGKPIRTLDNHVGAVNDVALRPGVAADAPPIVASVGEDRTVRLWQPTIGRLMRFARLPSIPRAIAWSSDGSRLLVGGNDGRLRLLDPDTVEIIREERALDRRIHAIAIGPAMDQVLLAGESGAVTLQW